MMLLQTVNFSQNPCDDFYNFACGRFGEDHPIDDRYTHNSWFLEKELRLNRLVQNILEAPVTSSDLECVKRTKYFYQACVNSTELNHLGLEPLFELLELVELPRSIPTKEEAETFNLGKTLALAQRHLSQDILITVSLERIGNRNMTTVQNTTVLKLSPSVTGLSVFKRWKPDTDILALRNGKTFGEKIEHGETEGHDSLKRLSARRVILATISFITEICREIVKELEMNDSYNSTELVATAYKIITFTAELIKDWNNKNNETIDEEDQYMTFSEFQAILDEESKNEMVSNKVDWKEYISTLFENANVTYNIDTDIVIIESMEYFKFLSRVLGEAKPVTIQRHVWWKLIEEFGKYTTTNMRHAYEKYKHALYGESVPSSRSETCTLTMRNYMNIALSHQMAKMDNISAATEKVRQMLKDIEKVFGSLVDSLSWMDPVTKSMTLDKAQSIKDEIGYPPFLFEDEKVEKFYEKLDLQKSEFLKNIIRINEWEVDKVLVTVGPDKEDQNENVTWFSNPLQVNAYYSRFDNAITIPPGILQTPFYFRGLESLNYGAIGSILGHELTHGFDTDGKNYNKLGERVENLWPEKVTKEYENRAKCFVKQYEQYKIHNIKRLNGTVTLAENIADNGGMRESFKAYKLYSSRNGKEPKLPGFEKFTHEQLLFLSFANVSV
ncbi:UNVERIFIED_CONTAM: hypothetical protein PYX00_010396 [Menopon gallinae]|uniref:Uncharacterized protein n=1 Tax=Menopon gallinae TaxID=328185 RepID=A0AAW2HF15_9NEOP